MSNSIKATVQVTESPRINYIKEHIAEEGDWTDYKSYKIGIQDQTCFNCKKDVPLMENNIIIKKRKVFLLCDECLKNIVRPLEVIKEL